MVKFIKGEKHVPYGDKMHNIVNNESFILHFRVQMNAINIMIPAPMDVIFVSVENNYV